MEADNLSCLEEKEIIMYPISEATNDEEYFSFEHKNNEKTSNKRRLIITTTSTDPVK